MLQDTDFFPVLVPGIMKLLEVQGCHLGKHGQQYLCFCGDSTKEIDRNKINKLVLTDSYSLITKYISLLAKKTKRKEIERLGNRWALAPLGGE